MKIIDPVLAPDVSDWCDHIKSQEFEDGGCGSIVVGLYPITQNGKWVLHPTCRKQCQDVMTKSHLVLQAYIWDDITIDAAKQADWVVDTIQMEGLAVRWIWGDQEQWWTSWPAWWNKEAYIPKADPVRLSLHNHDFMKRLYYRFPNSGVYTNKNFVNSYAPNMDLWLPMYHSWVGHYGHQPKERTKMTWDQLKQYWMPNYNIILSAGQPEPMVAGHQFTGDECVLPGSYNRYDGLIPGYDGRLPLDVSAFRKDFIQAISAGSPVPTPAPVPAPVPLPPPPPPVPSGYTAIAWSWIFAAPNDGAGCKLVGSVTAGTSLTITNFSSDGLWANLSAPVIGWMRKINVRR